jgi:hypothetical protein
VLQHAPGVVRAERRDLVDLGSRRSPICVCLGQGGRTFIAADRSRHPSPPSRLRDLIIRDLISGPAGMKCLDPAPLTHTSTPFPTSVPTSKESR